MDRSIEAEVPGELLAVYPFARSPFRVDAMPGGHIHRNFLVTRGRGRYVLQKLNGLVFPDIDAVVSNGERIVAHLRAGGHLCPQLIETTSGALSHRTTGGSTWRAFRYLEGTMELTTATGPTVAFETARAFADYREVMSDLPDPPLAVTLERFHDLPSRLEALDIVVGSDPVGRLRDVRYQVDRARHLGRLVSESLTRDHEYPVRTVHNDAKLSNVRFDTESGLAACVVDFDTTMAGRVRSDVGELVRSLTTHAPEDSSDEAAVDYDLELLEGLVKGYFFQHAGLEPPEIDGLAWAGPELAVENGLRFLADHLAGDRYFTIERPGQNLDRCRTHLRLTELMLASLAETEACFSRAAHSLMSRADEKVPDPF